MHQEQFENIISVSSKDKCVLIQPRGWPLQAQVMLIGLWTRSVCVTGIWEKCKNAFHAKQYSSSIQKSADKICFQIWFERRTSSSDWILAEQVIYNKII